MDFFTVQYVPSGDDRFPIHRERIPVTELNRAEWEAVSTLVSNYITKEAAHVAAGGRSEGQHDPLFNLRWAVAIREHMIDRTLDVEPEELDCLRWLITTAPAEVRADLKKFDAAISAALSKWYEKFEDSPAHTNKIQACEWRTRPLA